MTSPTLAADPFAEVFCCPRCRAPLSPKGGVCRCGTVCTQEGPVLNLLGDSAFRTPAKNDVAMADWLVINHALVGDGLKELRLTRDGSQKTSTRDFAQLAAGGGVTLDDLAHLVDSGPFLQILNDLNGFASGEAWLTETVRFMLESAPVEPDSRILDAGCSCGRHMWELAEQAAAPPALLVGLDIHLIGMAVGALAWERYGSAGRPRWCCGSILRLPFRDESFTQVNSFCTLSSVPAQVALREVARVLAPGGRAVLTLEGMGQWRQFWDDAPRFGMNRLNLLRWWFGAKLLEYGVNWQHYPLWPKMSGFTQFTPGTATRLVRRAGLTVERCEVLGEYRGQPIVMGVAAHKPGSARSQAALGQRRELQYQ
jgi:SAM-dependent methyltransferase